MTSCDEPMQVIHRDIAGEHVESRDCWCRPVLLRPEETAEYLRAHPGDTPVGKDA